MKTLLIRTTVLLVSFLGIPWVSMGQSQFGGVHAENTSNGWVAFDSAKISPYWDYEAHYDSCRVLYVVSNFRVNGSRLELSGWSNKDQTKNLTADSLSMVSNTGSFTTNTGDTLSFYREFNWFNPVTGTRTTTNYRGQDSLDFVIELINQSNGSRLALIDSFGILKQVPSGTPSLHGSRPIVTQGKYVISSGLNGYTAFMRVRVYKRGNGPHWVARFSGIAHDHVGQLEDSTWQAYISTYGGGLGKRSIQELQGALSNTLVNLQVQPNPTTGSSRIIFDAGQGTTGIVVYDQLGEVVYAPILSIDQSGPREVLFTPFSGGTFYVALLREGVVVRTCKLTVIK